jgi:hypothetical protein
VGWCCFRTHLELPAAENPKARDQKLAELSRGWAIASARFREKLQEKPAGRATADGKAGECRAIAPPLRTPRWKQYASLPGGIVSNLGLTPFGTPPKFPLPGDAPHG